MAYLFQDGFETGDLSKWDAYVDTSVATAKSGMTGSYCGYVGYSVGLNGYLRKDITPSTGTTLYGSLLYWCDFSLTQGVCFSIFTGVDTQIRTLILDNGRMRVDRYTTQIANSDSGLFVTQTTHKIDFYVYIADSGGRVVVYVDDAGTPAIDYTGDTRYTSGNIDNFRLGCTTGVYAKGYYDNIALDDSEYPTFGVLPRTSGPLPMYRRGLYPQ